MQLPTGVVGDRLGGEARKGLDGNPALALVAWRLKHAN